MSYPETVWQWMKEVSTRFPSLSWPQAKALACYSLGIVLANTCGLTQVADSLAEVLGQKRQTCQQRLREWRNEAKAKSGAQRQEVVVSACFAPLLAWIISRWDPMSKQLVLVLDATTVADRFVVLSISVVLRSCAIPVAWYRKPSRGQRSPQAALVRLAGGAAGRGSPRLAGAGHGRPRTLRQVAL